MRPAAADRPPRADGPGADRARDLAQATTGYPVPPPAGTCSTGRRPPAYGVGRRLDDGGVPDRPLLRPGRHRLGRRPATVDLAEAVATSHIVVMVARADRRSATRAAAALAGLRDADTTAATRLVLVDVARTPDRVADPLSRALGAAVPTLPHEPGWAADPGPSAVRFGARTRRAHIDLAVMVMTEAVRSQQPLKAGRPPLRGEVPRW